MRDVPEASDPELPVYQKADICGIFTEALDDSRHQIPNDDQITDTNTKALDGYRSIEDDGGIRIGNLRESEKGGGPSVEVPGASCLKIETEACCDASP